MKRALLLLFLFSIFCCKAQVIVLRGDYTGKNIFVQNPRHGSGNDFCTDKILVNGKETGFVNDVAYEIHLDSMHFKTGDSVRIEIFHKPDCKPKVLNNFNHHRNISGYREFHIDSLAVLHWISENEKDTLSFIVQQFRWNKWITIGEVRSKGPRQKNEYSFQTSPHSGKNQFRLLHCIGCFSQTVDFINAEKVKILPCKLTGAIEFDNETDFEIYNSYGTIIKTGRSKSIDISELETGSYYLNFDDKMSEFIVKRDKEGKKVLGKIF